MMSDSTTHIPEGSWQFDESVTEVFDDMLERSIPDYGGMRELSTEAAKLGLNLPHNGQKTRVIDLGCSRGEAIHRLRHSLGEVNVEYEGVEVSTPMARAAKTRFQGSPDVSVFCMDVVDYLDTEPEYSVNVYLSILTLQFTPLDHRAKILESVYRSLKVGGVLVIVEKVLGSSATVDGWLVDGYHNMKERNGYTREAIVRKEAALNGVLVPLTAEVNELCLRRAGFGDLDCFWRHRNFAGWVARKTR